MVQSVFVVSAGAAREKCSTLQRKLLKKKLKKRANELIH